MIKINSWVSLVIQWLRFQASTWELRFHMLCSAAKEKEKAFANTQQKAQNTEDTNHKKDKK